MKPETERLGISKVITVHVKDFSAPSAYVPGLFSDDKHGALSNRLGMTLPNLGDLAGTDRFNWRSLRHFAAHIALARGALRSRYRGRWGTRG